MVVMEDGLPRTSEYRRFKIRQVDGNDDYAAMAEVLTRRLTAFLEEQALPVEERPGRFSYPPQLLLVDGGKGQLGVAERVVAELGLADRIPVASLAKQLEEVFRPGSSEPVKLERGSEGLYLLQRIRDESHRFAIDYHRRLRSKRMTGSVLDGIPGLGPTRRKRLVAAFGGVRAVQRAPLEDLVALSWLPDAVGEAVGLGDPADAQCLGLAGGPAGTADHDEACIRSTQLGQRAHSHVDALEGLDATGEEEDGARSQPGGTAGHDLGTRREEGMVHPGRDHLDTGPFGAVQVNELSDLLGTVCQQDVGAPHHLALGPDPPWRLRIATLGLHHAEGVEGRDEWEVQLVLQTMPCDRAQPVVGEDPVVARVGGQPGGHAVCEVVDDARQVLLGEVVCSGIDVDHAEPRLHVHDGRRVQIHPACEDGRATTGLGEG